MDDLEDAYQWIVKTRKDYSPNSDIWNLRRDWNTVKYILLDQLNNGSYAFSPLERYEMDDNVIISLWSSQDMIALKLITQALGNTMANYIPQSCYHVKDHGGLKKAVVHTHAALSEYQYVFRSDIKSYYDSINFDILITNIEYYVRHPILLKLIEKACRRTETYGGIFYDYHEKGLPRGSPLSPLLGAIALMPLDQAMGGNENIFYARFMDDWVVLVRSKTALRKVIKQIHQILRALKFELHPMKTYIGKISHGFNFLAYYMDDQKILPSQETIRRFHERGTALYEQPVDGLRRHRYHNPNRDISDYPVNEAAPTDEMLGEIITSLREEKYSECDTIKRVRRYVDQWACWLKLGLSTMEAFLTSIRTFLPSLSSCWRDSTGTNLCPGHCF